MIIIDLNETEVEYLEYLLKNSISEMEGKVEKKGSDDYLLLCDFNKYVANTILYKMKEK